MSSGGNLVLVAGSSRSGKTYWTAQQIKHATHLLVWDAVGEFSASFRCRKLTTARQLHAIAAAAPAGRFAFVSPVTADTFETFCRFAWVWLRVVAAKGARATLVIEELADVTPPGKAPAAWGEIIRKGLRFNPDIYALTQSPAESDKTVMRNATVLHVHAMQRQHDRATMARELDCDLALLDSLDFARFEYLERDRRTRELMKGGKGSQPKKLA